MKFISYQPGLSCQTCTALFNRLRILDNSRIDSRTLLDEAIFGSNVTIFSPISYCYQIYIFLQILFSKPQSVNYCVILLISKPGCSQEAVCWQTNYLFIQPTETLVWRTFYNAALYYYSAQTLDIRKISTCKFTYIRHFFRTTGFQIQYIDFS